MASEVLNKYPPYQWYIGLESLPVGFPMYDVNLNGDYIVATGEVFCRAPFEKGESDLCGRKFVSRGAVITHLKHFHRHTKVEKIETGRSSGVKLVKARAYYKRLFTKFQEMNHGPIVTQTGSSVQSHVQPPVQEVVQPQQVPPPPPPPSYTSGSSLWDQQCKEGTEKGRS
ncbi:hypothetical protein BU23DRAFT_596095 [Bimuria novae-zelandiae CBS 107.79]|uniref:Uncharacterized protein n=1 Tax=Bimuria novae-zelandiae CBS 107.79 TaxID=1447943 RepID=A0A6A5VMD7_9PLEO|nr:hypothetical protein BU23DRAFT_596095 [Bimuria novae-zelandiae CBS 107.79]